LHERYIAGEQAMAGTPPPKPVAAAPRRAARR
jgi:hypothetical protein